MTQQETGEKRNSLWLKNVLSEQTEVLHNFHLVEAAKYIATYAIWHEFIGNDTNIAMVVTDLMGARPDDPAESAAIFDSVIQAVAEVREQS